MTRDDPTIPPRPSIAKQATRTSPRIETHDAPVEMRREDVMRAFKELHDELADLRSESRRPAPTSPNAGGSGVKSMRPPGEAPKPAHWLVHLAAAIAAFGTVVGGTATVIKELRAEPPVCVSPAQLSSAVAKQAGIDSAQNAYDMAFRAKVMGVWALQGVKATDPPGAPVAEAPLDLLPKPVVQQGRGSTKVPAAPLIQLRDPIPLPPLDGTAH